MKVGAYILTETGKNRSIVVIALVTACCLLGDSMLYIALPIYWQEAGLTSLWQVGVLLAVNRVVRLPLNPIVGRIYEKVPLKSGLLFAVILSVATTVSYGIATSFFVWFIFRCFWGLAWSFLRIGGLTSVAMYGGENRGEIMGLYNGLYRLGSLVGMLIGGILVPFVGLTWVAIGFGGLSAMGAVILAMFFQAQPHQKQTDALQKKAFEGLRIIKRHMLTMASGFTITFLIQGVLAATLSSLILFHYGKEVRIGTFIITAAALSGTLQALRWLWEPFVARKIGRWSDGEKGRQPLFITSLIVGSVGYYLLAYSFSPLLWIGLTLMTLMVATALTTLMDAIASDESKKEHTVRFFTYYTVTQDFGAACGPIAGYLFLMNGRGYMWLYMACGMILIILMICWRWKGRREDRLSAIT